MKKLYILILLFSASFTNAQNGITYQAVILNPEGEYLPGVDNSRTPLVNKNICLLFKILNEGSLLEYQETLSTTTDEFGMVNVIIGTGIKTGGSASNFAGINWDGNPKNLVVELDTRGKCSNFLEISNQPFTSVPFALYATNSGNTATPGPDGKSAYQVWLDKGNTGNEQSFFDSLTGLSGFNTLINTTSELAGTNCSNGGVKVDVGIDINRNGVLEYNEVSSTKYICDGIVPNGTNIGNTTFWDGSKWVVDNNHLYNDGHNVMIGTQAIEQSAALVIESNNRGVLFPRMTLVERDLIVNPTIGLLIFQTDNNLGFYYYNGSTWTPFVLENNSNNSNSSSLIYTINGF